MFTGIVEELGTIIKITRGNSRQRIYIDCCKILEDIHVGDSIAVNGVCLTVVEFGKKYFMADVMNETFTRSSLGVLNVRDTVNLERAVLVNGRFGGHIVSGHIDGTGRIRSIKKDGNAVWFEISADKKILDGIVEKGSVAIDGISLTVADITPVSFKVSVIPHTLQETVLGNRKCGHIVNLENDVIGKYVKKFTNNTNNNGLSQDLLIANGF